MSFSNDDLAAIFSGQDREHTGYGQGILLSFDPNTFENTVDFRGATLTNLPVAVGIEALTFRPGDSVLLMKWTPTGGGLSSYWIAGRPIVPGAGAELILRGGDVIIGDGANLRVESADGTRFIEMRDGTTFFGLPGNWHPGVIRTIGSGNPFIQMSPPIATSFPSDPISANRPTRISLAGSVAGNPGSFLNYSHMHYQIGSGAEPIGGSFFCTSNGGFNAIAGGHFAATVGGRVVLDGDDFVQVNTPSNTASTNCNLTSIDGGTHGRIFRTTSAAAAKLDVEDYAPDVNAVLQLKPRIWRDKGEVEADPNTDRWHVGYIAEEVNDIGLTDMVDYDEEGNPNNITYDRMSAALLAVIKDQQKRIERLEKRLGVSEREVAKERIKPARCKPKRKPLACEMYADTEKQAPVHIPYQATDFV